MSKRAVVPWHRYIFPITRLGGLLATALTIFGLLLLTMTTSSSYKTAITFRQQPPGSPGDPGIAGASSVSTADLDKAVGELQERLDALQLHISHAVKHELHDFHKLQPRHTQQQPPQPQPIAKVPAGKVHHAAKARSACNRGSTPGIKLTVTDKLVAPVVVVTHKRVQYLAKCLTTLLKYWSSDPANAQRFPLFVSVDDGDPAVTQFAAALELTAGIQVIHNIRDTSRCPPNQGYCNLSLHFQMLLQLFFDCHKAPRLLFVEDDLEVAPDFFSYFAASAPLLDRDQSLMCVSAWNDHGQRGRAADPTALYRTDIFPGLGWMLTSRLGLELYKDWPDYYWDEYMREPSVRRGRQCLFPEVSRTFTFGKDGTTGGNHYDKHLAGVLLNKESIDWSQQNMSQYEDAAYARQMQQWLDAAEKLEPSKDVGVLCDSNLPDMTEQGDLVLQYSSGASFTALAKKLPPMLTDLKGGPVKPGTPMLPRSSYRGIVMVRCRGRRLFLVPKPGSPAEPSQIHNTNTTLSAHKKQQQQLLPNT